MSSATQSQPLNASQRSLRATSWPRVFLVLLGERLRERRWTPLTWGGAFGAMGALMVLVWPSIEDTVSKLIDSYPEELMKAFGITGFNTVEQYIDGELFGLMIPFAAAFLVVRCVIRPLGAAEDAGQLDTWLTMPISRRALTWSAFASAGIVLAATLLVMWAVTMATSVLTGAGMSGGALGRAVVNVWPLAMTFAGIAVVATGAFRGAGRANGAAMGVLVAMYLVDLVGKLAPDLADLRYASAFRLYGSAIQSGLDAGHVAVLCASALLLAAAGGEMFQRRDV